MPDSDDRKKFDEDFLFSEKNILYAKFKKIIYEMLYAITLSCAGNENVFYKMVAIINSKLFGKIKIKDLILTLPKEKLLKICNALRAILNCLGYYGENSELKENEFLKKCQIVIDFLSAVQMCKYKISQEDDFILAEDSPRRPRLQTLIENYFNALEPMTENIGNFLHAKFCEVTPPSKEASALVEEEICKIVHPAISDAIDNLAENKSEILILSLEEIYNLMSCVQKNSKCEKRSIVLKLIELTKASQEYKVFNNFLKRHLKKK